MISIVLPTYNGSRFIDQSIRSVVEQTWRDWELIIVDDASTDQTPRRIDWWAARDHRIQAIHLPKNRKLPGALNEGFSRARGDFHTWTSDDNWYHPEALARMAGVLEEHADVGVVNTDSTAVDVTGRVIAHGKAGSAEELFSGNRIGGCFLYRREVTAALDGYDEDLFGAEDYDFWIRASLRFRFRQIGEPLYFHRAHKGSLTVQKYHLIARNVERAVRRWLPQVAWPDEMARLTAHIEWGVRCLRADRWSEIYEPWLREAPWLDADMRSYARREALKRARQVVWEAYYRRDWRDFQKFRAYLPEVQDDPDVARLLARRFYPHWVYGLYDQVCGARNRVRSWLSAAAGGA